MKTTLRRIFALLLAVCATSSVACADWDSFWAGVKLDMRRVNAWPAPFNFVDRDQVNAPLAAMVAKGWQRQNTLGRFYFDQQTQRLTQAGERRIHLILTQNPPQYRTIFVVRSERPEESEARVRNVQALVQSMGGSDVLVMPTSIEPHGWSAEYINVIDTKMLQSLPDPVLPDKAASGGSGS